MYPVSCVTYVPGLYQLGPNIRLQPTAARVIMKPPRLKRRR